MNIHKHNLLENLESIKNLIQQSEFIAFDCEFTGINLVNDEMHKYDSLEDIYQKSKHLCQNFNVNQIGLTFYIHDKEKNLYEAHPYNFILNKKSSFVKTVQLYQTSSMSFLAEHQFDFKNQFLDGMNFEKLKDKTFIEEKISETPNPKHFLLESRKTQELKTKIYDKITEFLASDNKKVEIDCGSQFLLKKLLRPVKLEELMNQKLNLSLSSKKNSNTILVLQRKKIKSEQKIEEEIPNNDVDSKNLNEKNKNDLNSSEKIKLEMGFSSIIEFIIQSKKPIVGHYLILDILFIYESFIDDLPDDFSSFKQKIHEIFPFIYDTKHINYHCQKHCSLRNSLSNMYEDLITLPLFQNHLNYKINDNAVFQKYIANKLNHEAGYDSLMTGNSFIVMMSFLKFKEETKKEEKSKKANILENNKKKDKSTKQASNNLKTEINEEKKEENNFQIENYSNVLHHLNGPIYLNGDKNINDFIDDPRYLKSVIFLESSTCIIKENLLKIFEDYQLDIHVFFLDNKNFAFLEILHSYGEMNEIFYLNLIQELNEKQSGKMKFFKYSERKKFKAKKITF